MTHDCGQAHGDEWDQTYVEAGYAWCHLHEEWHRPPECTLGQDGLVHTGWGTAEAVPARSGG